MTKWNTETLSNLPTFQAMMEHGSVSKAAEALGLTQSAVSKHLTRLRETYQDPLFVRTSAGMRPTAHAVWMSKHVASILAEARILGEARIFDPRTLTGSLTIATTDEVRRALLSPMMDLIETQIPRARLTFKSLKSDYYFDELEAGQTDLAISVNWHAPEGLKQARLFVDPFVCLVGAGCALPGTVLDQDTYVGLPHILVAPFGFTQGAVDEVLVQRGLTRFVRLSVPDFQQITPELLGDRYVVTLPAWVAGNLQDRHPGAFRVHPLPIPVPEIAYYVLWHERYDKDPKNKWLRDEIKGILGRLRR